MSKEKLIPEIRFSGFNGEWVKTSFAETSVVKSCRRIYRHETTEKSDILFYKIGSFGGEADSYISKDLYSKYKKEFSYPNVGDILISASGTLGRTVVYQGEEAYFQDSNIIWLDNDKTKLKNKFLLQLFETIKWKGVEGSTIKRLYNSNILETKYHITSLTEQEKIGALFEKIDKAIELQEKLVEENKSFKKSMLQKMFPKKGVDIPEIRFSGFKNKWELLKLDNVISEEFKGKAKENDLSKGSIEYLDADRLNGGQPFLSNAIEDVSENDILILWDGSMAGKVYTGFKGVLGSTLKSYVIGGEFNSYFIYAKLKKDEELIQLRYRTPNIPHVIKDFTQIYEIKIPSLPEQKAIGSFFKSLDKKIVLEEKKLENYKTLKKALLQKMFI